MADRVGKRVLRADGTVFNVMPVAPAALTIGLLLVALFVFVKPEASNGLGALARLSFWTLHVGLGLGALWVASCCLARGELLPANALTAVLLTGMIGVAIAAPGYLALDTLFASYVVDLDPDAPAESLFAQLVDETMDLAPWFLVTWVLVNLPVLLPQPALLSSGIFPDDTADAHDTKDSIAITPDIVETPLSDSQQNFSNELHEVGRMEQIDVPVRQFLSSLPGIIGTDVVAIASDLHYLKVWTVDGRTTVLGNLRDVVAELDAKGMQVHRSHWVAHAHVHRIVGTASKAACVMSNELRVPVSRRRWKTVQEQYGRGVVHRTQRK